MTKRLRVQLIDGWSDYSQENPNGPALFLRDNSVNPGALQVSLTEYREGKIPNPSTNDLIELSVRTGNERNFGELVETNSGDCALGKYGTAIFRSSEYPRIQVWYLSNGRDFGLVTHIGANNSKEITEAQKIVEGITLVNKVWWKFW